MNAHSSDALVDGYEVWLWSSRNYFIVSIPIHLKLT